MAQSYDKPDHAAGNGASYVRAPLLDLYPPITPYSSGYLELDHGHQMYWEQSGNPDGVPIVFLHGGPGGVGAPINRQFFDPDHYRIILYNQRGAGRSNPHGSIEHNTLPELVDDIEKIRGHLNIEKWHLFGGSWGSTLALAYAAKHSQRCISMILRGIFLMEQEEVDWFMHGMRSFFPEAWEQFAHFIPEDERGNLLDGYYKRLTGKDADIVTEAAIRWCLYESACASLIPHYETITTKEQKDNAVSLARIECHYFKNNVIAPKNSLLTKVDAFRAVPSTIIQGRYDTVCPISTAHRLHQAWPEADYIIVPDGGHAALDPAIRSRLIEATENAKTL